MSRYPSRNRAIRTPFGTVVDDNTYAARLAELTAEYPGSMFIRLSRGEYAVVDPTDHEALNNRRWNLGKAGYAQRAPRGAPAEYMHRAIMKTPPGLYTDHINRNKLDNRRCNLRVVTQSRNISNRNRDPRNKSGVTGVYFHAAAQKWCAEIKVDGRRHYLGLFESHEMAATTRRDAELRLLGEIV